jgi:hypothetical protein
MDEGDLEPKKPAVRCLVDQLDPLLGKAFQLALKIADLIGHMVHARPAAGEKLAYRRFVTKRCQQLDAALADTNGRRFDALLLDGVSVLDLGAEQSAVCLKGLVEILDGHSEMMNPLRLHARRSYP